MDGHHVEPADGRLAVAWATFTGTATVRPEDASGRAVRCGIEDRAAVAPHQFRLDQVSDASRVTSR
jgi:hypothetical protein